MDLYTKMMRVKAIGDELVTIDQTMKTLRYLGGTVNYETTKRCLAISRNLSDRLDELYEEFLELKESIEKELGYEGS